MTDAVQLLLDSLRIYSPSMQESQLSSLLQNRMNESGFRNVRTDRAGNAIGEVGRGKPHVLLCGHMDTIPGVLEVRQDGGRIYGRGAVDAKSPMCAMVSAASDFSNDLHVTVACVTREEGDSLGVNTLISQGGDYDYAVFGEPGGASRFAVGYRGRIEGRLMVRTPGGHAASSWARPSAVDEAMSVLNAMREYEGRHTVKDDHYRSLNISLTMISGGSYSNVIPNQCDVTLDIRIPPGVSSKMVETELLALVSANQKKDVRFELKFEEPTEPYETPPDSILLRAFQRSILKELSTRPIMTHKTGTGDMNTMAHRMGIACVTYGPGDSRLEHTDGEYVEVDDYLNSIRVIQGALKELRTLHPVH